MYKLGRANEWQAAVGQACKQSQVINEGENLKEEEKRE